MLVAVQSEGPGVDPRPQIHHLGHLRCDGAHRVVNELGANHSPDLPCEVQEKIAR